MEFGKGLFGRFSFLADSLWLFARDLSFAGGFDRLWWFLVVCGRCLS